MHHGRASFEAITRDSSSLGVASEAWSTTGDTVSVLLLRCTERLLKLMGRRAGPLVEAEPGVDDWYANVFVIERRKCLLPLHADTLFPVLDVDVRAAQFDRLGMYVAGLVVDALASEGLSVSALGPTDPGGIRVARTASRSVLGHMNEIALETQHLVAKAGGPQHADLDAIGRWLRRRLHGRDGGYVVPLELAAARSD